MLDNIWQIFLKNCKILLIFLKPIQDWGDASVGKMLAMPLWRLNLVPWNLYQNKQTKLARSTGAGLQSLSGEAEAEGSHRHSLASYSCWIETLSIQLGTLSQKKLENNRGRLSKLSSSALVYTHTHTMYMHTYTYTVKLRHVAVNFPPHYSR